MRYPSFIKKNSTIGLCAPSFGCPEDPHFSRLKNAISVLKEKNINTIEGANIWSLKGLRSNSKEERAQEFMKLWEDEKIDFISSVAGGEVMFEILECIDFSLLSKQKPKYFMGFSDNTILTFTITTLLDVASIYFENTGGFGMEPWHQAITRGFAFINGDYKFQESFSKYQIKDLKWEGPNPLVSYNCTENVFWKNLCHEKKLTIKGRMLGGCLDCLVMLCGTKFDQVKEFTEKYKDDKILWYLETCDLNSVSTYRALLQLKMAGWFKYASGFVFGRPNNLDTPFDYQYTDALTEALGELNLPIIYDADFGHVAPMLTIINGAIGEFTSEDGKGSLKTTLV